MSRYGDEEFKELELYLKQAEEDIVRSFTEADNSLSTSSLSTSLGDNGRSYTGAEETNNNGEATDNVTADIDENCNTELVPHCDTRSSARLHPDHDLNFNSYSESGRDSGPLILTGYSSNGNSVCHTNTKSEHDSSAFDLTGDLTGDSSDGDSNHNTYTESSSNSNTPIVTGGEYLSSNSSSSELNTASSSSETETVSGEDGINKELDINDILDLYDNVAFYSQTRERGSPVQRYARTVDTDLGKTAAETVDNKNHSHEICKNQFANFTNKDAIIRKLFNAEENGNSEINDVSVIDTTNDSNGDCLKVINDIGADCLTSEKVTIKGDINYSKFSKGCEHKDNCPRSRSLPWEKSEPTSQPSQVVEKTGTPNFTDDLVNCKSQNIQCNRQATGKQSSMNSQEVSLGSNKEESEQSLGSSGRSFSQAASFSSGNTPIDGKVPNYLKGDNRELDNRVSSDIGDSVMDGREVIGSTVNGVSSTVLSGTDSASSNKSHCAGNGTLNLEEFLEEINDSIDELISANKEDNRRSSGTKSDNGDLNRRSAEMKECTLSVENSDVKGKKLISESGILGARDKNTDESIEGEQVEMNENVVETDAGFYWLTCSIDGGDDDKKKGQHNEDPSKPVLENCDGAIKQNGDELRLNASEIVNVSDDFKHENLNTRKDSTERIGKIPSIENIGAVSTSESRQLNRNQTNEIKQSSKIETLRKSLENFQLKDHLLTVDSSKKDTRKYSCPESVFKVFKVVSVDIPKVKNPTVEEPSHSKSRSCDTLPTQCSRSRAEVRNSLEQKKEKILSYLEELNNIGINTKSHVSSQNEESVQRPLSEEARNNAQTIRNSTYKARSKGMKPVVAKKPNNIQQESINCGQKTTAELSKDESNTVERHRHKSLETRHRSLETRVDPPAMFQDVTPNHHSAPILEPPPDFAVNVVDVPCAMTSLPVWEPTVSPPGTSCRLSGESTVDRKYKHPHSPPPPSVHQTENLISSALNPFNHRKYSADASIGLKHLKPPPEMMRRKSADSGIQSEYVDIDLYQDEDCQNCDGKSKSSATYKDKNDNVTNGDVMHLLPNGKMYSESKNSTHLNRHSPLEIKNMLDLLNSYQYGSEHNRKDSMVNSGTDGDKMCHNSVQVTVPVKTSEKDEPFPIYATVEKKLKYNQTEEVTPMNTGSTVTNDSTVNTSSKKLKPIPVAPPKVPAPFIPPKPKCLSEGFENRPRKVSVESEHSAELQMMINSLSPVLIRRNSSTRRRKTGSSSETSPESTPDVSPQGRPRPSQVEGPEKSLFMDPKMAKTWHGATSTNWSNIYGPQMRAMMKELNELTNGTNVQSSDTSINTVKSVESDDDYEARCKTLPSSKSLLDEMHKKFCSDQYSRDNNAEMARALVLFRLKNQSPIKPKRSQSFNIRMGTGKSYSRTAGMAAASSSSASSESSPMIPRASERLRIKTRPDVQYPPKLPPRTRRGVTPEPLKLEESDDQAEHCRKEEAEIEAIEACRWLRETGFPQYAQLYEDGQFPVDIDAVEKDHDFLDKEDIQSLFRRLNTLNKCAIMKIGTPTKKEAEDSDEDDQCALSDKWRYQRSSRRWSRKDLEPQLIDTRNGQPRLKSASSHDSLLADQNSSSETGDSPVLDSKMHHLNEDMVFKTKIATFDANGNATIGISPKVIRRSPTDRLKGPKSFLKRMESLKGRRGSKKHKTITEISDPVVADNEDMQAKLKHLNCRDITTTNDGRKTPVSTASVNDEREITANRNSSELIISPRNESLSVVTPNSKTDANSLNSSVSSEKSLHSGSRNAVSVTLNDNSIAMEGRTVDSPVISVNGALGLDMSTLSRNSNSSDTTNSSQETLFMPAEYRPGKFPKLLDDSLFNTDSNIRTRSYSYDDEKSAEDKALRRGSHDPRRQIHRVSIYDNVPIEEDLASAKEELDIILSELFQNINGLNKAINGDDAELLEPPSLSSLDDSSIVSVDSSCTPEPLTDRRRSDDITQDGPDPDETEIISGTLSSPDISDHELPTEETSHDDSAEHIVVRERRDSGVGSSLTRTNSERRKYRIRWHSFQKSHRPTSESRNLQLFSLSAGQLLVLRKLSLLKLTALIEKYAPNRSGWSLTVPRFMKRHKVPDYRDKNVFCVPFYVMIQRTGQALPQCILHAMRFLRRTGADSVGIFRKSGVRSRIQKLRNEMEANPEAVDFDELQSYDVADLVKQYFRELPECLLTTKLSDIFISIFIYVPVDLRTEALQAAVVLMTDENRDVLQSLLLFLSDIAKHANKHQMTASNLAVCFAPSLFNMGGGRHPSQTPSPRRNRKNPGIPDARELMEQKAAHECLTVMIQECKKIFTIPAITLSKCRVLHEDPVTLDELNSQSGDCTSNQGYTAHIDSCIQGLLKESREKFRGWVNMPVHMDVDVAYKKVGDGHPLRLWKCTVDVEAPPNEVLNRILNDRQMWDEDLLQWNTVEKLDTQTEVFQYVRNSMAPHPTRDFCALRSWRTDLPKGACVLISTSIDHQKAELVGGLRAVELASRYLIEPCGTGKSRLTHISRVDVRGHSPDWYKKVYGHICANFMDRIRSTFHCNTEGPETKV